MFWRNPMLGPIIFITKYVYRVMNIIIGPSVDITRHDF